MRAKVYFIIIFILFFQFSVHNIYANSKIKKSNFILILPFQVENNFEQFLYLSHGMNKLLNLLFFSTPNYETITFADRENISKELFQGKTFLNSNEIKKLIYSTQADILITGKIKVVRNKINFNITVVDNNSNKSFTLDNIQINNFDSRAFTSKVFLRLIDEIQNRFNISSGVTYSLKKEISKSFFPKFYIGKSYLKALYLENLSFMTSKIQFTKLHRKRKKNLFIKNRLHFLSLFKSSKSWRSNKRFRKKYNDYYRKNKKNIKSYIDFLYLLVDLGEASYRKKNYNASQYYYKNSLHIMNVLKKQYTLFYAKILSRLADIQFQLADSVSAAGSYLNAREIMISLNYSKSLFFLKNQINLGNAYSASVQYNLAKKYFNESLDFISKYELKNSPYYALLLNNRGNIFYKIKDNDKAYQNYLEAKTWLETRKLENSNLYLTVLYNMARISAIKNNLNQAGFLFRQIEIGTFMLGLSPSRLQADSMYNSALVYNKRKQKKRSKTLFEGAKKIYKRIGLRKEAKVYSKSLSYMKPMAYLLANKIPYLTKLGLTSEEEERIKSYCGAYSYARHRPVIRSRTYKGRLIDTNVLIRDLLNSYRRDYKALNFLRKKLIHVKTNWTGKNLFFIDIGPAVANKNKPAVTSKSLANEFKNMPVVALDLPNEVMRFKKYVKRRAKRKLLKHKNIHIFSGDGIISLRKQFLKKKNWILKDRNVPQIKENTPVVIRAANSIDIYITWNVIKNTLKTMATDFKSNSLLLLFNRSLLFKPAYSDKLKIIGFLSIRGFHHNTRSFSRGGQTAYTLSEISLHKNKNFKVSNYLD